MGLFTAILPLSDGLAFAHIKTDVGIVLLQALEGQVVVSRSLRLRVLTSQGMTCLIMREQKTVLSEALTTLKMALHQVWFMPVL